MRRNYLNGDETDGISAQNPFRQIRERQQIVDLSRKEWLLDNMHIYMNLKSKRHDDNDDDVWLN